jgi:predicted RNA-binding Zn-ribbon protein involved in translation (DUF1610 family)
LALSITCHSCGQRLPIANDYKHRKMQCSGCGVFLEVPAPARGKSVPAKSLPAQTGEPPKPDADEAAIDLALEVWSDPHVPPQANNPAAAHARQESPAPPAPKGQTPLAEPEITYSDEDDGRAYGLVGGDERKCPSCSKVLTKDATLCPHCGFNLETGKKAVRVYEPLELHWDAGLPLRRRLVLFVIAECPAVALTLTGLFLGEYPGQFVTSWLVFTALLAFLLGTFDRLNLTRNKRGRVVLTQTWRVLFFARPTTAIALGEYEGVVTNLSHDVGILDWIILGIALMSGIIPGVIWWFWAMQQDTFQVALAKDHGYPERILYRGWSESRAKEIAQTLHDVGGLPHVG